MTRLSNRQYPVLKTFVDHQHEYFTIEDAQYFDQRPFRSMLIQKWIEFIPATGFRVTKGGLAAMREFLHTDIFRRDPTMPLTAYFDPTAYGLAAPAKKKKSAAAAAPSTVREFQRTRQAGAA